MLVQGFPSDASKPDMARDRFFAITIIGQHPAAYAQNFRSSVQGQIIFVHPIPNALVTDATRLLYRKIAQIICCQVNFAFPKLNRTPKLA